MRIADDRDFRTFPRVSRDLLDSINEIYFLLRRAPLLSGEDVSVLDIGAGYGRLAHRMLTAVPNITRYYCVDAVPESTFLCDWYLRYRGLADRATVVPLDMLDRLGERRIDLAVNVRSFTEMSYPPIATWIGLIAELGIGTLMIVPNEGNVFCSRERDGRRRSCFELLKSHGFKLVADEPVILDPDIREFTGWDEHFLIFEA